MCFKPIILHGVVSLYRADKLNQKAKNMHCKADGDFEGAGILVAHGEPTDPLIMCSSSSLVTQQQIRCVTFCDSDTGPYTVTLVPEAYFWQNKDWAITFFYISGWQYINQDIIAKCIHSQLSCA